MATILQKNIDSIDYRVTKAGNSIRLYRNHVLHSQWNHRYPLKGTLWDLFLLTSFSLQKSLNKVLVLGAGGGAVINLVHHYFPSARVDAVEQDKTHIEIAKKFFRINQNKCNLFHADARDWLLSNKGTSYDLIVDDVFTEMNQVPSRAISAGTDWSELLLKRLSSQGTLVINFADQSEWNKCRKEYLESKFFRTLQMGVAIHKACQNRVVHIANRSLSAKHIKNSLREGNGKEYIKFWSLGDFNYRRVQ